MKVEKIEYRLRWKYLKIGESFFIPCLDHDKAKEEINKEAKEWKMRVLAKGVVEHGLKGLRVWRI